MLSSNLDKAVDDSLNGPLTSAAHRQAFCTNPLRRAFASKRCQVEFVEATNALLVYAQYQWSKQAQEEEEQLVRRGEMHSSRSFLYELVE
eukprot:1124937-Amphidinium_carterae.1